ncbi:MAG: LD-carboxypeptidase [Proteobacteria bacterium]|nr:LD-carboxypeptidase [Pseudomonadota bacterium]MBU4294888.1 LD-carboxypeptidase [Pseudomonadota bacterium]MCG2750121.1 LD-carboxypeptidase [Desulfobulbaceae bacterium]
MPATAEQPARIPLALHRGDTIGLVAPAGPWDEEEFARGVQILDQYGFKVKIARDLATRQNYLAGPDRHRADIFHEIWRDPGVKAVLSVRGGYGSLRILAAIDYELIREQPKIFIGFSDITALHNAISQQTGLTTFHGPMVTTLAKIDKESLLSFFDTITSGTCRPISDPSVEILKSGQAAGRLSGGNLTTAIHLLATPYEVSWRDKIVFLEDVGEAPYRIDRMLTHLKMAGRFAGIRGLILGSFTNCGDEELIWTRAMELFADEEVPIWANFPIGHGKRNMIVPMGSDAVMDSSSRMLSFPAPCCRMP